MCVCVFFCFLFICLRFNMVQQYRREDCLKWRMMTSIFLGMLKPPTSVRTLLPLNLRKLYSRRFPNLLIDSSTQNPGVAIGFSCRFKWHSLSLRLTCWNLLDFTLGSIGKAFRLAEKGREHVGPWVGTHWTQYHPAVAWVGFKMIQDGSREHQSVPLNRGPEMAIRACEGYAARVAAAEGLWRLLLGDIG